MNQRATNNQDEFRAIARRGVLYDQDLGLGQSRGLLFLAYQQDLGRQFEFLQSRWANDPNFPDVRRSGGDCVVGNMPLTDKVAHRWISDWGIGSRGTQVRLDKLTSFRGGEYFFTPPPNFLQTL